MCVCSCARALPNIVIFLPLSLQVVEHVIVIGVSCLYVRARLCVCQLARIGGGGGS